MNQIIANFVEVNLFGDLKDSLCPHPGFKNLAEFPLQVMVLALIEQLFYVEIFEMVQIRFKTLFKVSFLFSETTSELIYFLYRGLFCFQLGNFSFHLILAVGYILRNISLKLRQCFLARIFIYGRNDIVRKIQNMFQVTR